MVDKYIVTFQRTINLPKSPSVRNMSHFFRTISDQFGPDAKIRFVNELSCTVTFDREETESEYYKRLKAEKKANSKRNKKIKHVLKRSFNKKEI